MLQQFLDNVIKADGKPLADKTKNAYKLTLKNLETYFKKDLHTIFASIESQTLVYDYIQELAVQDKRKYDIICICCKYINHFKELHQEYFPTKVVRANVSEEKVQAKKDLPSKTELLEILRDAKIQSSEHQLILNLLLKYACVQRCDLATVKLKNFDIKLDNYILEGKLVINTLNKVKGKKSIEIELSETDKELLLKLNQNFLYTSESKDRCNAYSKMISVITKKYLGIKLSQTNFRIIHSVHNYHSIENDPDLNLKQKINKLNELCESMGHSLMMSLNTYINI
jgi:hypothetical protein